MANDIPSGACPVTACSLSEKQPRTEHTSPSVYRDVEDPVSRSQAGSAFARNISTETLRSRRRMREKRTAELRKKFSPGGVPSNERLHVLCQHVMDCGRGLFLCPGCWLLPMNCVCGNYRVVKSRIKVVVHIHHNEWCVSSNTGCIIKSSLEDCELLMRGHKDHDARLCELLQSPDMSPCILWPGQDALTPAQFKERVGLDDARRVVVITPDASFRCARKMVAKYPADIPRVGLSSESVLKGSRNSLLYPVRQYGGSEYETGRVSTLEAVAAFLLELGEDQHVADVMLHNMKTKMDQVLLQQGKKAIYGTTGGAADAVAVHQVQRKDSNVAVSEADANVHGSS